MIWMLQRIMLLAAAGLAVAMLIRLLDEQDDQAALERELALQMDGLREQLFKR